MTVLCKRRGVSTDPRNDLLLRFVDLAVALKPKLIVLENVPTLLGPRGRLYIREASLRFSSRLCGACHYLGGGGFWCAAVSSQGVDRRSAPKHEKIVSLSRTHTPNERSQGCARRDWRPAPPSRHFSAHPDYANHTRVRMSDLNLRRLSFVPEGEITRIYQNNSDYRAIKFRMGIVTSTYLDVCVGTALPRRSPRCLTISLAAVSHILQRTEA